MSRIGRYIVAVGLAALAAACGPRFIPGTRIRDDMTSRDVLKACERYRAAMEKLDFDLVAALTHPDYFERNGDNNSQNNYDYEGLVRLLASDDFRKISKISVTFVYHKIEFPEEFGGREAHVRYHYTANWRMPPPRFQEVRKEGRNGAEEVVEDNYDEQRWFSRSEDNLMILRKDDRGEWRFVRGL